MGKEKEGVREKSDLREEQDSKERRFSGAVEEIMKGRANWGQGDIAPLPSGDR